MLFVCKTALAPVLERPVAHGSEGDDDDEEDVDVAVDARIRRWDAHRRCLLAWHRRSLRCRQPLEMCRLLDAIIADGREVVSVDHLLRTEAEVAGILADKTAREDRGRQRLVIVSLDRFEKAFADLRGVGDLLQRDTA